MDNWEIVTITPHDQAGYYLAAWGIWLGIAVLVVLWSVFVATPYYRANKARFREDQIGWPSGVAITVGFLLAVFGTMGVFVGGDIGGSTWDLEQRERALTVLGYKHIDVYEDRFVASRDGLYIEGSFAQIDGDKWAVVPLVEGE